MRKGRRRLYAALRELDAAQVDIILARERR